MFHYICIIYIQLYSITLYLYSNYNLIIRSDWIDGSTRVRYRVKPSTYVLYELFKISYIGEIWSSETDSIRVIFFAKSRLSISQNEKFKIPRRCLPKFPSFRDAAALERGKKHERQRRRRRAM